MLIRHKFYYRLFEIIPGLLAWSVLIFSIPLAYFFPRFFICAMIVYAIYWLYKTILMSYRMVKGYHFFNKNRRTDWTQKLNNSHFDISWRDLYHLVIVPTYKEDLKIIESSIQSVINSNYPKERLIYVLATEERDKVNAERISKYIMNKYSSAINKIIVTCHPKDLPNEIKGKGSNIYYAAKQAVKYIDTKKIPYRNVLVTTMDADNLFDKNYPACLSYTYVSSKNRRNKSYQPIPMFFNNIWDVPMPMRLMAMGSSFWQIIVASQPHLLRNFSAHAQSLDALIATDFWSKTTIVEDGHQYWRSYFAFNGDYEVVPMFTPVYMDAVLAESFGKTIKEQYLQKRRWSWGVSDVPYVFTKMLDQKQIPLFDRCYKFFLLFESHLTWSTASLILAVVAWYPFIFGRTYLTSIYAYSFPVVYSRIFLLAWIGMIVTLILSTLLLPPPKKKKIHRFFYLAKEWILTPIILPITNIFLSSIPALESQTRLMFKKYLGFRVTVKSTHRSGVFRSGE